MTTVNKGTPPFFLRSFGKKGGVPFFTIDRDNSLNLQDQIRQRIVERVAVGSLAPAQRLPSTRALARQLKVSRNTVAVAYQRLIADGHLEARPRSGIYVSNARHAALRRGELRAVDATIAGGPLDAAAESAARDAGWRKTSNLAE